MNLNTNKNITFIFIVLSIFLVSCLLKENKSNNVIYIKDEFDIDLVSSKINNIDYEGYSTAYFGEGERKLEIFINPSCPYSIELIKKIRENFFDINENFSVNFKILPMITFDNYKIYDLLKIPNNKERIKAIFDNNYTSPYVITNNVVKEFYYLSSEIKRKNVNGTPTILSSYTDRLLFNKIIKDK